MAAVHVQGLDIGPDSLKTFQDALSDAKTVIWNGPMGVFEFEKFAKGTYGVANTLAELTPKVRPSSTRTAVGRRLKTHAIQPHPQHSANKLDP